MMKIHYWPAHQEFRNGTKKEEYVTIVPQPVMDRIVKKKQTGGW